MSDSTLTLAKLREFCVSLPDATEAVAWGHPVFKVSEKMFCGYEELDGKWTIGFKLEAPHADLMASDPRIRRAQNLGRHKWISMDIEGLSNWSEVYDLIIESYRLSASKRTLARFALSRHL